MKTKVSKTKSGSFGISMTGMTEGQLMALARALALYSLNSPVANDVKESYLYATTDVVDISESFVVK